MGSAKARKAGKGKPCVKAVTLVMSPARTANGGATVQRGPTSTPTKAKNQNVKSPRSPNTARSKTTALSKPSKRSLLRRTSIPLSNLGSDDEEAGVCKTPKQESPPLIVRADDSESPSPSPLWFTPPMRQSMRNRSPLNINSSAARCGSPPRKTRDERFRAIFGPSGVPETPQRSTRTPRFRALFEDSPDSSGGTFDNRSRKRFHPLFEDSPHARDSRAGIFDRPLRVVLDLGPGALFAGSGAPDPPADRFYSPPRKSREERFRAIFGPTGVPGAPRWVKHKRRARSPPDMHRGGDTVVRNMAVILDGGGWQRNT
eukprot:GEMP01006732.1.p1 GENE.GEMP01006732.1~~GEMP01006732.1.p1  ORF type:complete len:368 (+),score=82.04 GEMP01006732.1:160-1104(+)